MTGSLAHLLAAAAAFVGGHFVLSAPPIRAMLVSSIGEKTFAGMYSAIAIVNLVWLGFAFGAAPHVELWAAPAAARWIPILVTPLATLFVVCGVSQYNPTTVIDRFDSGRADAAPGILKVTRHPVMWAVGLWALAHIPPNGDLAALILFGSLAFLALFGTIRIEAKRRARDPEGFARFAAASSNIPFAAILAGRAGLSLADIGWLRIAIAALLYVVLFAVHRWIAGVPIH